MFQFLLVYLWHEPKPLARTRTTDIEVDLNVREGLEGLYHGLFERPRLHAWMGRGI